MYLIVRFAEKEFVGGMSGLLSSSHDDSFISISHPSCTLCFSIAIVDEKW